MLTSYAGHDHRMDVRKDREGLIQAPFDPVRNRTEGVYMATSR